MSQNVLVMVFVKRQQPVSDSNVGEYFTFNENYQLSDLSDGSE